MRVFGYIRILEPELKIREFACYRGAYCGLCRQMGKCTGQCSRLTLRYDAAAMVLLRMAARGTTPEFTKKRCFLHPLTKADVLRPCEETETVACIMAALAYHKCKDDIADELTVASGKDQTAHIEKVIDNARNGVYEDGEIINMNYGTNFGNNKGNYFIYYAGKLYRTTLTKKEAEN